MKTPHRRRGRGLFARANRISVVVERNAAHAGGCVTDSAFIIIGVDDDNEGGVGGALQDAGTSPPMSCNY